MTLSKVLIHRNPQFGKCPACKKSGTIHRSRSRSVLEQIAQLTSIIKIYKCKECGWRGFRSTLVITKKSVQSIFAYLVLIIIAAFIVRYIILHYALN